VNSINGNTDFDGLETAQTEANMSVVHNILNGSDALIGQESNLAMVA